MTRRSFALLCTGGALLASLLTILFADAHFAGARAQDISISFGNGENGGNGLTERAIQLIAIITVLSLAPAILVMVTSSRNAPANATMSFGRISSGRRQGRGRGEVEAPGAVSTKKERCMYRAYPQHSTASDTAAKTPTECKGSCTAPWTPTNR